MKNSLILVSLTVSQFVFGQQMYFPPLVGNTWSTVTPQELGWCPEFIPPLINYLGQRNTKAFLVLKDGKMVVEQYYGTFTQDSIWYWASAGKTITSFMVGLAQQEGHLGIDDVSAQYLGNGWTTCSANSEQAITIRHQLTMTTGLNDEVADLHCTQPSCLTCMATPGTRWSYHNAPYTLLDGVISGATGQTLNAYTQQKLLGPTGMTGLFVQTQSNNVFFSKPRSMARFGLLMLNQGTWNGNTIMTDADYFEQMTTTSQSLNQSYGYLWWLNGKPSFMTPYVQLQFPGSLFPSAPADMYSALGKNGQILNVVPSQGIVMVRMGNEPGAGDVPFMMNDTIWQYFNPVLCGTTTAGPVFSSDDASFTLLPNPANEDVAICGPKSAFSYQISDFLGKVLVSGKSESRQERVSVANLPAGVYLVTLQADNYRQMLRLIRE